MTPQEDTPHTFGAFLERHRLFIWKLCNRYADGDPAAGLDFVQEVTILLWLRFDRLRPDVHPRQEEKWINYIARDCFRSLRQGQKLSMEHYDNRRHPEPATETDTLFVNPGDTLFVNSDGTIVVNPGGTVVVSPGQASGVGVRGVDLLYRYTAVMPNPTRHRATVTSSFGLSRIDLYDARGRLLKSFPASGLKADLDLSPFPSGTYLLRILTPPAKPPKNSSSSRLPILPTDG